MKREPMPLEALEAVPASSLTRVEAEEAAKASTNGGNLIVAIQDHAAKEIARLEAENAVDVARVLSRNQQIAALRTHSQISPKEDA